MESWSAYWTRLLGLFCGYSISIDLVSTQKPEEPSVSSLSTENLYSPSTDSEVESRWEVPMMILRLYRTCHAKLSTTHACKAFILRLWVFVKLIFINFRALLDGEGACGIFYSVSSEEPIRWIFKVSQRKARVSSGMVLGRGFQGGDAGSPHSPSWVWI